MDFVQITIYKKNLVIQTHYDSKDQIELGHTMFFFVNTTSVKCIIFLQVILAFTECLQVMKNNNEVWLSPPAQPPGRVLPQKFPSR